MPKFLDSHPFSGVTEERLKEAQASPPDEFGVDHHEKLGIKLDWVTEVNSTV
jgi:hypothetical protein